jgi:hypothetical protein
MDAGETERDRRREGEDGDLALGVGSDLLRAGQRCLDASFVADARGTAVALQQSLMGFENGLDRG